MKVLFISSANKASGISPIVNNQGESFLEFDLKVDYYPIVGKGLKGYLLNILPLRRKIKSENYFVLHAHNSFSGMLTSIACPFHKRVFVSLMGSFYKTTAKYYIIKLFAFFLWHKVIVKSTRMSKQINLENSVIIPNGVQISKYLRSNERELIRKELGFEDHIKYIIFIGDIFHPNKNYKLCEDALRILNADNVKLVPVFNKSHQEVIKYQIAADVLMLTSFLEGSPNVIKEAMAACCPIVATDVGDVRYVIGSIDGCYVLDSFSPHEAAEKLVKALAFNQRTDGLNVLKEKGLDANSVAEKIINLYSS